LLYALRDQRARAVDTAYGYIAGNRLDEALAAATEVEACRQDNESRLLLALIHLLRRDFPQAWACYQDGKADAER
jgi:hypothetical protein